MLLGVKSIFLLKMICPVMFIMNNVPCSLTLWIDIVILFSDGLGNVFIVYNFYNFQLDLLQNIHFFDNSISIIKKYLYVIDTFFPTIYIYFLFVSYVRFIYAISNHVENFNCIVTF